jgi:SNF2 family DNA or RNA helicase
MRPIPYTPPIDWTSLTFLTPRCRELMTDMQKHAVDTAVRKHGGRSLIAMEMGAGKTLVGCVLASYYGGRILFIVPGAKCEDWEEEAYEWTGIDARIISASKDRITDEDKAIIISYDLAKIHPDIQGSSWDTVIVDESHMLKAEDTIRARVLVPIIAGAKCVALLSGTPQTSRPSELFTQLHTIAPDVFRSRDEFARRYCKGHFDKWGVFKDDGIENEDELHLVLTRLMFRCTTAEAVPDLPPKYRYRVHGYLPKDHPALALYAKEKALRTQYGKQSKDAESEEDRDKFERLRQEQSTKLWIMTGLIKLRAYVDYGANLIEAHPDERFLIFVVHLPCVDFIVDRLTERGIKTMNISGKVQMKKRKKMVNGFQDDDTDIRAAVLTIASSGTGLNFTAATRILIFENAQTPGLMLQAEGRAHRQGVKGAVHVYYFTIRGLYDDEQLGRLNSRSDGNSKVVDGRSEHALTFDENINCEALRSVPMDLAFLKENDERRAKVRSKSRSSQKRNGKSSMAACKKSLPKPPWVT